jgi:hypothetical protein
MRFERLSATSFCFGAALVLAAFLWPAVPLLPGGSVAFSGYLPGEFPWSLFVVGYVVMAAGLWRLTLWSRTTVTI